MNSFDASRPEICELGKRPELGVVPENMHVFCIRQNRFGEPKDAWQREVLPVPEIGPTTSRRSRSMNWPLRANSIPVCRARLASMESAKPTSSCTRTNTRTETWPVWSMRPNRAKGQVD